MWLVLLLDDLLGLGDRGGGGVFVANVLTIKGLTTALERKTQRFEGGHHYDNLNQEEQGLLEHLGSDVVLLSLQGPLSLVPAAISPSCSMCRRPTARSCWISAL